MDTSSFNLWRSKALPRDVVPYLFCSLKLAVHQIIQYWKVMQQREQNLSLFCTKTTPTWSHSYAECHPLFSVPFLPSPQQENQQHSRHSDCSCVGLFLPLVRCSPCSLVEIGSHLAPEAEFRKPSNSTWDKKGKTRREKGETTTPTSLRKGLSNSRGKMDEFFYEMW